MTHKFDTEMTMAESEILLMMARGELLDTDNNPVPAVTVLQNGGGEYETRRYAIDLFGKLICTSVEIE